MPISTDSNESENGKAQGVITRVDLCTNLADYSTPTGTYLTNGGNSKNCAENFTWSWKQGAGNKHAKLNWMALSPDETYILAVGAKGTLNNVSRWVVKIDVNTGKTVWEFELGSGLPPLTLL